jgi:hypothetical protein
MYRAHSRDRHALGSTFYSERDEASKLTAAFGHTSGVEDFAGTEGFGIIGAAGNRYRRAAVISHAHSDVVGDSYREKHDKRDDCRCDDDAAEESDPLPEAVYRLKPRWALHADIIDVRRPSSERRGIRRAVVTLRSAPSARSSWARTWTQLVASAENGSESESEASASGC